MSGFSAQPDRCPDCDRVLASSSGLCAACLWAGIDSSDGTLLLPGLEVVEEIARGGMGVVYRALERGAGRDVAVKMMLTSIADTRDARERFTQEARAVGAMDHPGILPVYQVGEHDGLPYFTMKLAAGGTLAARLAALYGRWREIAALLGDIADAVDHAHKHGLLHRDLKPANILFDAEGRSYVSDFGLVKIAGEASDLTRTIALLGTPHYLAPEVAARDARCASVASDIWSLGAILYEMLAGHLPFEADGIPSLLRRIVEDEPQPLAKSPRDLATIAEKCLRKNPASRYSTAAELAGDLRAWLEGRTISARRATMSEKVRSWGRRNPALATGIGALVITLSAIIILQARSTRALKAEKAAALSAQVAAARMGGKIEQRDASLAAARDAAKFRATDELRDDAITLLATPGWREIGESHVTSGQALFFSPDLDTALVLRDGALMIHDLETSEASVSKLPAASQIGGILGTRSGITVWATDSSMPGVAHLYSFDRKTGTWALRKTHTGGGTGIIFNDETGRYATSHAGKSRVLIHDGETPIAVGSVNSRQQSFSPNGELLATSVTSNGATVIEIFDMLGTLRHRVELPPQVTSELSVKWRADGKAIAVANGRTECPIVYLDGPTPVVERLTGNGAGVSDVAWHPSGEWLVTAATDGTIRCWEATTRREIGRTALHAGGVDFSMDGKKLAAYQPESGRIVRFAFTAPSVVRQSLLPRHAGTDQGSEVPMPPWGCAFAAGEQIAVVTGSAGLEWVDPVTSAVIARGPAGTFWDVIEAAPEKVLALGITKGAAQVHSVGIKRSGDSWQPSESRASGREASAFALFPGTPAISVWRAGASLFVDHRGKGIVALKAAPFSGGQLALSRDGRWVACSPIVAEKMNGLAIWDTSRPDDAPRVLSGYSALSLGVFSPDGATLYVNSDSGITALNTETWGTRWRTPRTARSFSVNLIAVSGDGGLLAVAEAPLGIGLYEPATGRRLALLRHPDQRPYCKILLNHDGSRLLATGLPPSVQCWDLTTLRQELAGMGLGMNGF